MSADNPFDNPTALVVIKLDERNRFAQQTISTYASNHAWMDVVVGAVGLIPGAAIPALMAAIAAQGPLFYQPMARKLGQLYLADPDELARMREDVIEPSVLTTATLDIAADFGGEFLVLIAKDIIAEIGIGTLVTFIPIIGAFAAAGLDAIIATRMTHRVGRMVAMYYQNDARWVESRAHSYGLAKEMSGGPGDVRRCVDAVRQTLVRNVRAIAEMMKDAMEKSQIRDTLLKRGVPPDLVDDALAGFS